MWVESAAIRALSASPRPRWPVAHQLAELLVALVALRAEVVGLRLDSAAPRVGGEDAVDRLGRLPLAGDRAP